MKALRISAIAVAVLLVVVLASAYTGLFNVAADEPHWSITQR